MNSYKTLHHGQESRSQGAGMRRKGAITFGNPRNGNRTAPQHVSMEEPRHRPVKKVPVVEELLALPPRLGLVDSRLHSTARTGDAEATRRALDEHGGILSKDELQQTVLMKACESGSQECVSIALQKAIACSDAAGFAAYVNAADSRGKTALMRAAVLEGAGITNALLDAGADADAADNNGWNALMRACSNLRKDNVRALIFRTKDINAATGSGRTALEIAKTSRIRGPADCREVEAALREAGAR